MPPKKTTALPPVDLAAQLRAAIAASGLTHYALGKTSGVSPTVIGRFASGERDLKLDTASRLCRVLGLSLKR